MITTINEFKKSLNENRSLDSILKKQRLKSELRDLKKQLNDLFTEQDLEAGIKGSEWNDKDGNRYGKLLNDIEDKIDKKEKELDRLLNRTQTQTRTEKPETTLIRKLRKQLPEIKEFVNKYDQSWKEMKLSSEEIAKSFKNRFGITDEPSEIIISALKTIGVF